MEKEKIRDVVSTELMLTGLCNSHPSTMKELQESLVEALHQALSMSDVSDMFCPCTNGRRTYEVDNVHKCSQCNRLLKGQNYH